MTAENRNALQGISVLFVSCTFLALYSFTFDILHDYERASQNLIYLPYYIFIYLLSRTLGIIPLIVLYYLLSKNSKNIVFKIGSILIVLTIAAVLGKYVGKNDTNLSIDTDDWKYIPVYPIAAVSTCFFYEWLLARNRRLYK